MKKIKFDLNKLEREYLKPECSMLDLSKKYGCSETTINNKLKINNNLLVLKKMKKRFRTNIKFKKQKCCVDKCNKNVTRNNCCEFHYAKIYATKKINDYIKKNNSKIVDIIIRKSNKFIVYNTFVVLEIYEKNKNIKVKTIFSKEYLNIILQHTWNLHQQGYIMCRINKKNELLHRIIMKATKNTQIDHKDRNKLNNLRNNLRYASISENQVNKSKMSNNTSGITGVTWDNARNKWKSTLNIYNKCYNLGRYDTLKEAKKVRLKAEQKYHKNFIPIERQKLLNERESVDNEK